MTENILGAAQIAGVIQILRVVQEGQVELSNQVGSAHSELQLTRQELYELRETFDTFVANDALAKVLQRSETQLVGIRQQLETKFGHYGQVRRSSIGMLQALDAGLVTHSSLQSISEELMIVTPGYWLAPFLVSFAAWARDEQDLAQRAVEEAIARDSAKASLAYALLLRRYRRSEPSSLWLRRFLERSDPAALPRVFELVFEATAWGLFGPPAKRDIVELVQAWTMGAQPVVEQDQMVKRCRAALASLPESEPLPEFPLLSASATNWDFLQQQLRAAGLPSNIRAWLHRSLEGQLTAVSRLEERVDELLLALVSQYDEEELPLRREEASLQAIIRAEGDLAAAAPVIAERESELERVQSIGDLLVTSAFSGERTGQVTAGDRLALSLSKQWLAQAARNQSAERRLGEVRTAHITLPMLDGWTAPLENSSQVEQMEAAVEGMINVQTEAILKTVRLKAKYYLVAVLGLLGLILSLLISPIVFLFMLLVAIGLGGYTFLGWRSLQRLRETIRQDGDARKEAARQYLRGLDAEFVDYLAALDARDAEVEPVASRIDQISPTDYLPSDHGRGVL